MTAFITTLFLTFLFFGGAALCINYCKSRPRNGKHQLTGMCHKNGGASCCGSKNQQ
ncbi:MAG TPA: hypothetical protein VJ969_07600 [Desulfopila sp.]|nr:hypothetical protein [Desulfopila sp.]